MTQQDEHIRCDNMYVQYTCRHTHSHQHTQLLFFMTLNTYDYVFIALVCFLVVVFILLKPHKRG